MATFAIGDVHGNLVALQNLLELIFPELGNGDTLVFLGDYIDRGPDSRNCVEEIIRLKQDAPFSVVTLLGNHEEWMLATMHDYTKHSWLFNIEAFDTIASYSMDAANQLRTAMENAGATVITAMSLQPSTRLGNYEHWVYEYWLGHYRHRRDTP